MCNQVALVKLLDYSLLSGLQYFLSLWRKQKSFTHKVGNRGGFALGKVTWVKLGWPKCYPSLLLLRLLNLLKEVIANIVV